MLVVHEIVAETGAAVRDAAIGKLDIESSKRRWYVQEEQAVEEAYRGVPNRVIIESSWAWPVLT